MTEVKVILNRSILKDDKGVVIKGQDRPYSFEVRVGKLVLTSVWHFGPDEKSEGIADQLAKILEDVGEVTVEKKGVILGV